MSNTEKMLNAVINEREIENFAPGSRIEQMLLCIINKINKNSISEQYPSAEGVSF